MTKKGKLSSEHRRAISASMKKSWALRKAQTDRDSLQLARHGNTNPSLVALAKSRDVFRSSFLNLTAAQVRAVLDSPQTGDLLDWFEFAEKMVEEDPHLRGLVKKRKGSISSKELRITPKEDDNPSAQAAVEFTKTVLGDIKNFDRSLRQLMNGVFVGVGATETVWVREQSDKWGSHWGIEELVPIPGKRLRIGNIDNQWKYYLFNYGDFAPDDQNPFFKDWDKFILHSPGDEELPHYRGLLRALAFIYLFKKLAITYWLGGAEKNAFPAIYALVPTSTPDNIRASLVGALDSLTTDGAAVLNSDIQIQTVQTTATGGDVVYKSITSYLDTVMTKLVLGGTLVVEAASGPGGNRALGEVHERSQFEIIDSDAEALAETLRHQLIKPLLQKNLHLFGGVMPPLPHVQFDVVNREPQPIGQIHLQAAAITINELRKSAGLDPVPWGTERARFGAVVEDPAPETPDIETPSAPDLAKTVTPRDKSFKPEEIEDIEELT